ncbi:transmembrane protease serine 4a isoform X2 [Polyodon spathula]|nr:transmembrane protease serine 4a isoform X2 [Polyodon spathula]XP_041090934.1 transmembrane protease serine 4a isoform X2 [Polyodon spathula]XP_041090935.1 transmembrane protease serine 4a isoform X2 [Polyodon spathula]XP_041090936.1 transmembrane protease serine 4a isoform X2 [Polyodon spathula]
MTTRCIVITVVAVLVTLGILVGVSFLIKILLDYYYFFCIKSFKFIPLEKACDGIVDCKGSEDELNCVTKQTIKLTFPLRLVTDDGLLQVYSNASQSWRLVCAEGWQEALTNQACLELGYTSNPTSSQVLVRNLPAAMQGSYSWVNSPGNTRGIQSMLRDKDSCSSDSVVTLTCSGCGLKRSDRVVGGSDTTIQDWPWQVSLQYNKQHTCGGSLVTPRWIVTAAHCFPDNQKLLSRWGVVFGVTELTTQGAVGVSQVIIHGNYASNDNDIAMVMLSQPLTLSETVKPVCLPSYGLQLDANSPLWVTGWGNTQEKGKLAMVLQQAELAFLDREVCNRPISYAGLITPRMLCAGYLEGKVDSCQGDSGGPLVRLGDRWQLVGVVSWGSGCARPNRPGVYTNLGVFLDWIHGIMQQYS